MKNFFPKGFLYAYVLVLGLVSSSTVQVAAFLSSFSSSSTTPILFSAAVKNRFVLPQSTRLVRFNPLQAEGDDNTATTNNDTMMSTEVTVEKTNSDASDCLHTIRGSLQAKDLKNVFVEAQRDIAKRQTYPGFRPGVIPPFAQKPIKDFAIRMAIEDTVQRALQMEEMEVEGENIDILEPEDIENLVGKYNFQYDINFIAQAKAKAKEGKEEVKSNQNENVEDDSIIDVEAK